MDSKEDIIALSILALLAYLILWPSPIVGAPSHHDLPPISITEQELNCLASNIYWEGRGESLKGRLGIGLVTLNRVKDKAYPNSLCEVVYDPFQFSWYWDGKSDIPTDKLAYEDAERLAATLTDPASSIVDFTAGSLFYHADYVNPYWAASLRKTITVGTHIYYARN